MKRNLGTKIALIVGVSLLAISLVAGIAYANSSRAKSGARNKAETQVCDGGCKEATDGSAAVAGSGSRTRGRGLSQAKSQTKSRTCDCACTDNSETATRTRTRARDRVDTQTCDGACKAK